MRKRWPMKRRTVSLTEPQDRFLVWAANRLHMTPAEFLQLLVAEQAARAGKLRMRPEQLTPQGRREKGARP